MPEMPETAADKPPFESIAEVRRRLHDREITAAEVCDAYIASATARRDLNVYITETFDHARAQAAAADARIEKGAALPLDGIPLAVKDNFCTQGIRTTAGSRILENFVPTYESTITRRLAEAGAVMIGKANLDEFAMGSSTETSHYGPTKNPVGEALGLAGLVPGGSSGGSAAAIAGGLALGAIGSDTGGSIRQPASFCGIVGMKPTYGACSRWGIVAYASSLDQAGAFGNTVADVAILLDAMIAPDAADSTSIPDFKPELEAAAAAPRGKLRVGIVKDLMEGETTPEARLVWDRIIALAGDLDVEVREISLPHFAYALPAYYVIALSEASSNLSRYDGVRYGHRAGQFADLTEMYERTRAEGFGMEVKRRILMGTFSLSSGYYDQYYQKALKVRRLVADDFAAAFADCDVILSPTAPTGAFAVGAHGGDPVAMYLEDAFTVPVNLAGLPALSLPACSDARGMPLGIQVIGPQRGDATVIEAAALIEAAVKGRRE